LESLPSGQGLAEMELHDPRGGVRGTPRTPEHLGSGGKKRGAEGAHSKGDRVADAIVTDEAPRQERRSAGHQHQQRADDASDE
jgi:hypothetical protein